MTSGEHDQMNAFHEAGHAVVALIRQMPLESVEIWRAGEAGRARDGGYTKFIEGAWNPFTDRSFSQLWAGQEATDRWLTELGRGTDANRLDLRYMARNDAIAFDTKTAENGMAVPPTAGIVEARSLIDAGWTQVTTLAAALVARRRMSVDQVWDLLESNPATS
jgi:hypothetical protein